MKWIYFLIYVAAFIQVALLNIQARNAAQGKVFAAIIVSFILGTIQVFIVRSYVADYTYGVPFVFGGCLGAGFGIYVHKRLWRKGK